MSNTFLLCGHTLPPGYLTIEQKEVCETGPLNALIGKKYRLMRPHPSLRFCMQLLQIGEGEKEEEGGKGEKA